MTETMGGGDVIFDCNALLISVYLKLSNISNSNKQDRESLQDNLDKLVLWANDWQIRFNGSKCKVLHTGKNNPIYTYNIGDSIMEVTTAEKDLGIIVDDKLTFETHIDKTIKRANKLSGMIVHNIKCKDTGA